MAVSSRVVPVRDATAAPPCRPIFHMYDDDVAFILSPHGEQAVSWTQTLDFSGHARVASAAKVREKYPDHFTAVIEVATARAKASLKLRDCEDWVFTTEAVEQATPWRVARHRAERLAGRVVHDLTCSVGTELAELVRVSENVSGSDLDPVRVAMARANVPRASVEVSDALDPATIRAHSNAVFLADPARRASGRRISDPAELLPPLPDLLAALEGYGYAIKCAPGLDFDALEHTGEVEVTSLDGGVREACLWSTALSDGVRRRATVLHSGKHGATAWTETITDLDPQIDAAEPDAHAPADRFIVEPDGAIVRSGLVRHWAHRHGLRQLDPRIAHLTGAQIPAGYSGFEVLERSSLDVKKLRSRLRALDCGSLEILVRGVDKDPDVLRKKLAPKGSRPLALVVTRLADRGVAFICEARRHTTD